VTDFEKIYNTYFKDVYLYILRLSGNEHIAEEMTSDTFFKAMRAIDSFRGDSDVRVWLCQIAKNCYYSYMKKRNRTEHIAENEGADGSIGHILLHGTFCFTLSAL
jgi:RNA polymerase sigma-70 factor (ECF subfamily)